MMSTKMKTTDTPRVFEVIREAIPVTSLSPVRDEQWKYTDNQGHKHYWDDGYPTLKRSNEEEYYCYECADTHEDYSLVCVFCDEEITPGTKPPPNYSRFVTGMVRYLVDGEDVSEEEYRSYLNDG